MQGKPWNVYICRWKYIKTVTTYRNLGFYGETEPFEDPLLCHQFECRRRHFEKQLCNPWRKHTTSLKSTQMADQNVSSTNGFCLIYCLAAYAWVRIIRVRVQPWYESWYCFIKSGLNPISHRSDWRITSPYNISHFPTNEYREYPHSSTERCYLD